MTPVISAGDLVERMEKRANVLHPLFDVRERQLLREAAARIQELEGHVEQLVELLDIIKEHWIDYDHVYSISVHEARSALGEQPEVKE